MFLIFTFSTCKTLPCLRYASVNIWKPLKMLTVLSFLHYSFQHSYLACNPSSKSSLQDFRLLLCLIWNFLAKTRIFPLISFVFKWQNTEWKLWNFLDFLQMKFPSTVFKNSFSKLKAVWCIHCLRWLPSASPPAPP